MSSIEVPLADLGVIEVEHHLHVGMADGFHQGERVLGAGQRDAGVVDDGVEVLHAECHAGRRAQLADALQCAQRVVHISPVAR